jgi:hypothetical protein
MEKENKEESKKKNKKYDGVRGNIHLYYLLFK